MKTILMALLIMIVTLTTIPLSACGLITGESIGGPEVNETTIESYRFSLTNSTDGEITQTNNIEFAAPERYHVTETDDVGTREIIITGEQRYFKGDFEVFMLLQPVASYQRDISREATRKQLDMMKDIVELPEEDIKGVPCRHYRGAYDYEKQVRSMQESRTEKGLFPLSEAEIQDMLENFRKHVGGEVINLWIGKDDYLMRQMVINNLDPAEGAAAHRSVYEYYDFNEPIAIEAPLNAAGNLRDDWKTTAPKQPVFSYAITTSINNNDPTGRRIEFSMNITNTGSDKVTDIKVMVIPLTAEAGIWSSWESEGIVPYWMEPGASLGYTVTYGYDATTADPQTIAAALEGAGLYIGYRTPEGGLKMETVRFPVPDGIYTLPADLPPVYELSPVGEYRIGETGASEAWSAVSGEINGKKYLFVIVGTQNSDIQAPPGTLVLDIEDPAKPVRVAYLQAQEGTRYMLYMKLSGTVLYAAADEYLWIVDVSRPENPREIIRFTGVRPNTMAVSGQYAYVNDGNRKIVTLDVSNPADPRVLGSLDFVSKSGISLYLSNDRLLALATGTLSIIDITKPESPRIIDSPTFNMPDGTPGYIAGVAFGGDHACISLRGEETIGVSLVDTSGPAGLTELAFVEIEEQQFFGPSFVDKDRIYIFAAPKFTIGGRTRINIIDVSEPASPVELGYGELPNAWTFFDKPEGGGSWSFSLIDGYLYWFIGNSPQPPVIEIFDLAGLKD
jgi:hypothetical protein